MATKTERVLAQDWLLWGAVGCALVGTAHSEWSLAVSVGAHPWIAAAVPGALDLYVVRALRVGRNVFVAVLAMVAANVAWYLVHSGDLPVDWPLRSAVGALTPLVLWRVYLLKYTRTRKELLLGVPAGALTETGPGAVSAPESTSSQAVLEEPVGSAPAADPAPVLAPLTGCTYQMCAQGAHPHPLTWPCPDCECGCTSAGEVHPDPVPEYVLAEWSEQQAKKERRRGDSPVPYLTPVPDLPAEEVHPSAPVPGVLLPGDAEYLDPAGEYMSTADKPSARGLRAYLKADGCGVGQDRAARLYKHLGGKP